MTPTPDNPKRRAEDRYGDDPTGHVTLYRLDQLERRFDSRFIELSDKMDGLQLSHAQVTLIDYRLKELEKWKSKFFVFLATVTSSIVVIWITQLMYIIPKVKG